jgi:hypothetical protein
MPGVIPGVIPGVAPGVGAEEDVEVTAGEIPDFADAFRSAMSRFQEGMGLAPFLFVNFVTIKFFCMFFSSICF